MTPAARGRPRIVAASSNPSIPGMCASSRTKANGVACIGGLVERGERGRAAVGALRVAWPSGTASLPGFAGWSRCRPRPGRAARAAGPPPPAVGVRAPPAPGPNRAVKWNVLPRPTSLSTQIRPPISSNEPRRDRQPEARPAVLAGGRAVGLGERRRRRLRCFSGGMPIPVSRTAKCRTISHVLCRCRSADRDTSTTTSPASVNLMALPTRLVTTCRSRPGSPTSASGTSGGDVVGQLQPLLIGPQRQRVERVPQRVAQAEVHLLQVEPAGLDLGEVEDVVDHARAARRPTCGPCPGIRAARRPARCRPAVPPCR